MVSVGFVKKDIGDLMSYDHKISDLKYRVHALVPKDTCAKIIDIFEKYPELSNAEGSYKFKTGQRETDDFSCLNLSQVQQPNEDISYALAQGRKYIFEMVGLYVEYIKSQGICPDFNRLLLSRTDNIRILKYELGQSIKDHSDIDGNNRASCTLNLNEDYEGGEFRFFDGQIKESYSTGDAMLFPTEPVWIHGTEPITKGTRYSINCFLRS